MEFHQLTYTLRPDLVSPEPRTLIEWFPAHKKASSRRQELFNAGKLLGPRRGHKIEQVDVPTRKTDLLAWLNKECV